MIPIIPKQREHPSKSSKAFYDLLAYIAGEKEKRTGRSPSDDQEQASPGDPFAELKLRRTQSGEFEHLIDYATAKLDPDMQGEKCVAIRTHRVSDMTTAAAEMNAVARENTRCNDPAYHFILSWPEHECPAPDTMFDAAEHALKALGLEEHQYVIAVHGNTDNDHCHISVNRVHPVTFKARHIEWAAKTLQLAARESEIKHGWSHDNGIYIVKVDGHGKKSIVLNMDNADALSKATRSTGRAFAGEKLLPTWHDPDSLDSLLKTQVSKALRRDLPHLGGWPALHAWLEKQSIVLTDTGSGGMRLQATSPQTGEIVDVAASKGLRMLKRGDLEKRWGKFAHSALVPSMVPDTTHLTAAQLNMGIEEVIRQTPGRPPIHILAGSGIGTPPQRVIGTEPYFTAIASEGGGGPHVLPGGELDTRREVARGTAQDAPHGGLGNSQGGPDFDARRPGAGATGGSESESERSLGRDDSKRAERKEHRAAARADLRQRFSQYKRLVAAGDVEHFKRIKEGAADRRRALNAIRAESKAARAAIPKGTNLQIRLVTIFAIDAESLRREVQAEASFQEKSVSLRAARMPPLVWRAWLYEQANLADQAALSALRGIVYQAQRDAKKDDAIAPDEIDMAPADSEAYREQQYRNVMARLLEEEKGEVAIRSAKRNAMRPFEVDALLALYIGIQCRVTGNGNVEYSDQSGDHLFTDRGNRVTFDRARVSDEEICLALVHARQKFGNALALTGDDSDFTARMARLADDMGVMILNPEMTVVIEHHRADRAEQAAMAAKEKFITKTDGDFASNKPPLRQPLPQAPELVTPSSGAAASPAKTPTAQERLRTRILSIDPHAQFVLPDPSSGELHTGPVAATIDDAEQGFAQHTSRGMYVLHAGTAPRHTADATLEVRYINGVAVATLAPEAVPEVAKAKEVRATIEAHPPSLPVASQASSAHAWLANWAEHERKRVAPATREHSDTIYTVLHVAPDGVVLNLGRSGAVYPVPLALSVRVGDKVAVDSGGELCLSRTPDKGKDKVGR